MQRKGQKIGGLREKTTILSVQSHQKAREMIQKQTIYSLLLHNKMADKQLLLVWNICHKKATTNSWLNFVS